MPGDFFLFFFKELNAKKKKENVGGDGLMNSFANHGAITLFGNRYLNTNSGAFHNTHRHRFFILCRKRRMQFRVTESSDELYSFI